VTPNEAKKSCQMRGIRMVQSQWVLTFLGVLVLQFRTRIVTANSIGSGLYDGLS
jgi:hypothetical protein